jgi:hypothetical protein
MKKVSTLLALALALSACVPTSAFHLKFDTTEPTIQKELLSASLRVISRHLQAMNATLKDQNVERSSDGATITITMDNKVALAKLGERLLEPFSLALMKQVEENDPAATIKLAGHGAFAETGIDQTSLAWVYSMKDDQHPEKGKIQLVFTEQGQATLKKVFKATKGKMIGIFVRGILVSKVVSPGDAKEKIIIDNIPSQDLADAFADSINVGMHVTFTGVTP